MLELSGADPVLGVKSSERLTTTNTSLPHLGSTSLQCYTRRRCTLSKSSSGHVRTSLLKHTTLSSEFAKTKRLSWQAVLNWITQHSGRRFGTTPITTCTNIHTKTQCLGSRAQSMNPCPMRPYPDSVDHSVIPVTLPQALGSRSMSQYSTI